MNIDKNISIAYFLEFQKTNLGWFDSEGILADHETDNTFDVLKFDTDWNWLMKVIERIEQTNIQGKTIVSINTSIKSKEFYCTIDGKQYDRGFYTTIFGDNKLKVVWDACNEFIEYYNKQRK